jgi:hypothetical protein
MPDAMPSEHEIDESLTHRAGRSLLELGRRGGSQRFWQSEKRSFPTRSLQRPLSDRAGVERADLPHRIQANRSSKQARTWPDFARPR